MTGRTSAVTSRATVVIAVVLGVLVLGGVTYAIGQVTAPAPVEREPITVIDTTEVVIEPLPEMSSSTTPMSAESLSAPSARVSAPVRGAAAVRTAKGSSVKLTGGITVPVPKGWKVVGKPSRTGVTLGTTGAIMNVNVGQVQPGMLGTDVAADYLQSVVLPDVQGLKTSGAEAVSVGLSSVASAGQIPYTSSLVTQQGSLPIWGLVVAVIRFDGTTVVFDFFEDEAVNVDKAAAAIIKGTLRSL